MGIAFADYGAPSVDIFDHELVENAELFSRAMGDSWIASTAFGPMVLRHAEVQSLLRDRRLRTPAALGLELQGITSGPLYERTAKGILSLDGDDHARLRRLVNAAFNPKSADRLRPFMREVINELVDPLCARGGGDFVAEVTTQYPIPIICKLLGAPREDWEFFSRMTDSIFKVFGFNVAEDQEEIMAAFDALDVYVTAMVETRRHDPRSDLISDLIRAEEAGDRLDIDELKMMVEATLTAGTDTTRNQLAAAIEMFARHPDQWQMLAEHPDMAPAAVDEVMRHTPIISGTFRLVKDGIELNGIDLPAGTMLLLWTSSANSDPTVHDRPRDFDITRRAPVPHLTFGGGEHYCLGVNLARAELQEALGVLSQRLPGLRLDGPVEWKRTSGINGPLRLPICCDVNP